MKSEKFFGALVQRTEGSGGLVDFAGMKFIVAYNQLLNRIKNNTLEYSEDGTAKWRWTRSRFRAGREFRTKSHKIGQLMGHISRILDASNTSSAAWVPYDIFYLWVELRQSGWRLTDFRTAIQRLISANHNLQPLLSVATAFADCFEYALQE